MSINFPGSLDNGTSLPTTVSTEVLGLLGSGKGLAPIINDLNSSILALEAKVGANNSAVASSHDYKLANLPVANFTGKGQVLFVASSTATANEKIVADYVCDGTADNVEIQAAVTALGGSGLVHLSEGTFNIAATINIGGGGGTGAIVMEGSGWNTQLKLNNATNIYMFDFGTGGNPQFTMGLTMRDIYLNCNGANQTTAGGGIYARGAVWCKFDHLFIQTPWGEGIRFYQDGVGNYGHHNSIVDCLFRDGKDTNGGGGQAIKFQSTDENRVVGCTFQDNGKRTASYNDAQIYDTNGGIQFFVGNSFVGGGTNIPFIKSDSSPGRLMLSGNAFDGGNNTDMIQLAGDQNTIIGNTFLNVGNGASSGQVIGVHLNGSSAINNKIIGNQFSASTAYSTAVLEESSADKNIIEGNSFVGTWLSAAPVVTIGANTIVRSNQGVTEGTVLSSIIPTTDSAIDLGSSAPKYFANGYFDKIYLNSTAYFDGATAGQITSNASKIILGGSTFTTDSAVIYSEADNFFGIYGSGNARAYGLALSLPKPTIMGGTINSSVLGGYYAGLGIGGGTNQGSGQPIFGVLAANQSSNGLGQVAFTVIDTNYVCTYNNILDDGSGNMTIAGIFKPQQHATSGAPAYVKGAMYFDTTLNKLRIGGATAWETVTSV